MVGGETGPVGESDDVKEYSVACSGLGLQGLIGDGKATALEHWVVADSDEEVGDCQGPLVEPCWSSAVCNARARWTDICHAWRG